MHRNCVALLISLFDNQKRLFMSAWKHVDLNSNNIWGEGPLYGIVPYTADRLVPVPAGIRRLFARARQVRFAESVPLSSSTDVPNVVGGSKRKRCSLCFEVGHNSRSCKRK